MRQVHGGNSPSNCQNLLVNFDDVSLKRDGLSMAVQGDGLFVAVQV